MELYLQFGYGMMGLADELISSWGGGGVILSPRDLEQSQLAKVAKSIGKSSAEVLVDPQCYLHAADHGRLTSHEYWQQFGSKKTNDLINSRNVDCLEVLKDLNAELGCQSLILPGIYAESLDDLWWDFHESQMLGAMDIGLAPSEVQPTIALGASIVSNETSIDELIDRVRGWAPDRIYVVLETTSSYLSEDPLWLAGVFQLAAGLKVYGKKVLFGYANHQMLPLGAIGVDAIASGTWLNVRAFQPEKFMISNDDEVSRRAKGGWYYCPQALSEYKMPMLDVAQRTKVLPLMYPDPDSGYATALFSGVQPSLVDWGEKNAFLHYLTSLRDQCLATKKSSYDDAMFHVQAVLEKARGLLASLRKGGVRGNDRDFSEFVDVSEAALVLLDAAYGARLRRQRP
ncbi:hypothetical protein E2F46_15290 [Luteimonas aestuarii]|uniref:Uncharacterized protein n=1 Tax=Luteimonas aestuarii TaxID=453837 RepID=A0A4R5TJM8_9GAMM|nr:hypothetical protein [Luteimonas aestuarii]TDK21062.1 hypothetical protein E2F46_15290 [Luteimonas aestuarii]